MESVGCESAPCSLFNLQEITYRQQVALTAIENLPTWLTNRLRDHSLSFSDVQINDMSRSAVWAHAIEAAQGENTLSRSDSFGKHSTHPSQARHSATGYLVDRAECPASIDVIFSLDRPDFIHQNNDEFKHAVQCAAQVVVWALPYREDESEASGYSMLDARETEDTGLPITARQIPMVLKNTFRLIWSRVADCSTSQPQQTIRKIIVLVYAKEGWIGKPDTYLSDWSIEQKSCADEKQIEALKSEISRLQAEINRVTNYLNKTVQALEQIKVSASWKITKPLRLMARIIRYGLIPEDRQSFKNLCRKLYHWIPLSESSKRRIRASIKQVSKEAVVTIQRNLLLVEPFKIPALELKHSAHFDYVIWGCIDWHFRHQRPQQLAIALADRDRRVFYISPNFVNDSRAGFDLEILHPSKALFQIKLYIPGAPVIYDGVPDPETIKFLHKSLGQLLSWMESTHLISFVHHPFWFEIAAAVPNSRMIYDCMDHHEGFGNNNAGLMDLEKRLFQYADLTIVTSTWLSDFVETHAKRNILIRNAGDYEHFSKVPAQVYHEVQGRPVIGYYGAIAEWFDVDLLKAIATEFPECQVLLIGADTVDAKSRLSEFKNVTFTGEIPYSKLPYYLHAFSVCLLPFKIIPLTLATNPVKVYEYLSAAKPVVSVELPELQQFEHLVYTAGDPQRFIAAIHEILDRPEPAELIRQRTAFARSQTWQQRCESIIQSAESSDLSPAISVIVVTYNNLELTRACLASLDKYAQDICQEIIVVDNASTDGSQEFLNDWATCAPNRKVILNDSNRGFAAANNQGLNRATGQYLVLLNNDTHVTPGWALTLAKHLQRDQTIGLIGPVTNNIGNEAKIDIKYNTMDEMIAISSRYANLHIGQTIPLKTAAFFCVMLPKSVYEQIGPLDESFGLGFFEDDDYCRRIEKMGLRIVCAEDVFVHHHLSASFNKLPSPERQLLFETNRNIYESKWGPWTPHRYRPTSHDSTL